MTATLEDLRARHPDWSGWLDVVAAALRECADAQPRYLRPQAVADEHAASVVVALTQGIDVERMGEWLLEVVRRAAQSGLPGMRPLAQVRPSAGDAFKLFEAERDADHERLGAFAQRFGLDLEALRAVANLFVMPAMHACRATEAGRKALGNATTGHCACCGAWPAYAEIHGIERERRLCCGRCGGGWAHELLSCTYCGERDHEQLSRLVIEADGPQRAIEVCGRCHGYLKQFKHLTPSAPLDILLHDLDSIELDLAASARSCVRPRGVGRSGPLLVER
jgi:FdhE protein